MLKQINGAVAFRHQAPEGEVQQVERGGAMRSVFMHPGGLRYTVRSEEGKGDAMCMLCAWGVTCGVHGMQCSMMYACHVMSSHSMSCHDIC